MLAYWGVFCQATKRNTAKFGVGRRPAVISPAAVERQAAALLIASYNSSTAFSLVRTFSAPALIIAST